MNFWENYTKFCETVGKSPSRVAMDCGLSNSVVTKWKRGAIPDGKTITKLSEYFDIPVDFLFSDEKSENVILGSELKKIILKLAAELEYPPEVLEKIFLTNSAPRAINENNLRHLFKTVLGLYGEEAKPKGVMVKVYGTIAAGIPIDAIEDVVDEEEIPAAMARDGEYLGLKIKGDSMEPLIHNGATAIIRKQPDCESGQIAAVYINGDEATLKRVFKRSNGITLVPENPEYAPMSFSSGENCPVAILGVLKEIRMKF